MSFKEKMKLVFSSVWGFISPFVKIFVSSAGQILAGVALDVVKQIAADPSLVGSGNLDKRQAAFEKIKGELVARGLEASTSVINAAIEAAVQKLKDNSEE